MKYGTLCTPEGVAVRVAVVPDFVTDLEAYVLEVGVMPYIPDGFSMILTDEPPPLGNIYADGSFHHPWVYQGEPGDDGSIGYSLTQTVFHNGKVWKSLIDNNLSEPGVGWWEVQWPLP